MDPVWLNVLRPEYSEVLSLLIEADGLRREVMVLARERDEARADAAGALARLRGPQFVFAPMPADKQG